MRVSADEFDRTRAEVMTGVRYVGGRGCGDLQGAIIDCDYGLEEYEFTSRREGHRCHKNRGNQLRAGLVHGRRSKFASSCAACHARRRSRCKPAAHAGSREAWSARGQYPTIPGPSPPPCGMSLSGA